MSRVEGSDDQRIREMQEQQLRQQKDVEKRQGQERVAKSFGQVMTEKTGHEQATKQATKTKAKDEAGKKAVATKAQDEGAGRRVPKEQNDLARKAVLSRAAQEGQTAARAAHSESLKRAEGDRKAELVSLGDEEHERIERDVRTDDAKEAERDVLRLEERSDLESHASDGAYGDASREKDHDRSGQGESGRGRDRAEGVAAAEGPPAAHEVRIPEELVEKLISSMYAGLVKDGRSEMVVSLKGTMLEGVNLTVSLKKGKIRATFEGADRQTRNLIEASKGDLMRALARKGLELDFLRVK